jgi:hypothetical protein
MGGLSRERAAVLTGGEAAKRRLSQIRSWVCLTRDRGFPKRGGHGAKALFVREGLDHEEVKVQEGQAGCQDINDGLTTGSIFTRTKTL